jgi:cytochrome c biogenesis protein CcmG/thiol:disulfide interchange protein DsbE
MATERVENLAPLPEKIQPPLVRKRRIITFAIVTVLNIALIVVLWTQLMTPSANAPQDNNSLVGNAYTTLQGKPAPDFALPALNGESPQLRPSDFKGKALMINFWYSTCPPCKEEAPFLQQAWTRLTAQGSSVVLLGIDTPPDSEGEATAFLQDQKISYLNVRDEGGKTGINYGITGNPETFFIDKNGIVVSRWRGPLTESSLRTELARIGVQY